MQAPAISSLRSQEPDARWARQLEAPVGLPSTKQIPAEASAADIKRASMQFEAIILRQMLAPSLEPMMGGASKGMGGSGGGIYSYMLTDVLANSLSQGGGLGLGQVLQKKLGPPPPAPSTSQVDRSPPSALSSLAPAQRLPSSATATASVGPDTTPANQLPASATATTSAASASPNPAAAPAPRPVSRAR